jgi:hypothetical protein
MKKNWYTFLLLFVLLLGLAPIQQALHQFVSASSVIDTTLLFDVDEDEDDETTSKAEKLPIGISEFIVSGSTEIAIQALLLNTHTYGTASTSLMASPSVEIHVPPPNMA